MPESRSASEQVAAGLESKGAGQNGLVLQQKLSSSPTQSISRTPGFSTADSESNREQPESSDLEKFGLSGLLNMVRSEQSDQAALAVGQDLTQLGLDLNSPE
jgi:CCR4-NOT transcription complex subunit 2